jgi:putative colanic acid biosynthesis UDP-glucose lipid carrier transferase
MLVERGLAPALTVLSLWGLIWVYGVRFELPYKLLSVLAFLAATLVFQGAPGRDSFARRNALTEAISVTMSWIVLSLFLLLTAYATQTSEIFSRRVILTWFVATPPLLITARLLAQRLLVPAVRSADRARKVVIAGADDLGRALAGRIRADATLGMQLVGFFDDRSPERLGGLPGSRMLGGLAELPQYVRSNDVDVIFIALPIRNVQRVSDLIDELHDSTVSIYFIPDIFVFDLIQSRVTDIGGIPAIALCETPFFGPSGAVKRASDVALSSLMLLTLSPLLLLLALIIKLTSPGSVIFKQRRYGLDGREITVYKFRSMRVSDDGAEIKQATRDDPRITPIGKILRRYSLDELPQLFNVLQGRMSVVGPRPHAVAHNEEYRKLIKGYMLRHKVRPGLTGLAQVNGYRGETKDLEDMRKRVEYDLDYLRRWSVGLDIRIVLQTIGVVLKGEKAY